MLSYLLYIFDSLMWHVRKQCSCYTFVYINLEHTKHIFTDVNIQIWPPTFMQSNPWALCYASYSKLHSQSTATNERQFSLWKDTRKWNEFNKRIIQIQRKYPRRQIIWPLVNKWPTQCELQFVRRAVLSRLRKGNRSVKQVYCRQGPWATKPSDNEGLLSLRVAITNTGSLAEISCSTTNCRWRT